MEERSEFQNLEALLTRAGRSIAYPVTPALAPRVRERLQPRALSIGWLPRRAFIALMALIVALALLLAFPETREALAQFLGLRTIQIIPVTPTPTLSSPTLPVLPSPTRGGGAGGEVHIQCCETTLSDAQTKTKFRIMLPPSQIPSRVYLQNVPSFGNGQQVILVFDDPNAPRFVLYQATNFLYGKVVSGGTVVSEVQVNGQRALWLTGAPHLLVYLDATGRVQIESERVVNLNTLAWEMGEVTYRLETSLSQEAAIQFAESLR